MLVGREAELSAITSVLQDARSGHGSSLCFIGPPGIGKTSLLGVFGLSHIGLTVRDVPAAQRFWTSVMGFATLFEGAELCMVFEPSSRMAIGFSNQQGRADGSFDERHTGLDHLALAVADVAGLRRWERHLAELDVPHSAIEPSDAGHHLNLRGPDNFPIELFVLTNSGAASLGIVSGVAVAGTHLLPAPSA